VWGSNDAGAMFIYAVSYAPIPTPTPTSNPLATAIKISSNVTVSGTSFVENSATSYTLSVSITKDATNYITAEIAKTMLP
jgi:hypothetical protein